MSLRVMVQWMCALLSSSLIAVSIAFPFTIDFFTTDDSAGIYVEL